MGIEWSGTSWMYPWWSPNQSSQAQGNIQHTETTATTIHIIDHMDPEASDDGRSDDAMEFRKQLIKQLYSKILWDKDPLFHFFYEPFLIVRVTTKEALEGVRSHLDSNNINFLEYSYPFTDFKKPGITVCDERNSPLVAERSDIFMPLLHAHSVAALSLSDEEHSLYFERCVHTACNPRGISRSNEGLLLLEASSLKLDPKSLTPQHQKYLERVLQRSKDQKL